MKFTVNGYDYEAKTSTFPGGEEYVCLPKSLPISGGRISINADIRSSKEIMQLLMLTDALRRYADRDAEFVLNVLYLPYARQDRVCAEGESFSLKIMCNLINSLNFDKVNVADCHSDVGLALLDNVQHYTQLQCIRAKLETHNLVAGCDVIIAPDAGAAKKAQAVADSYGIPLIQCLKTRSPNGRIQVEVLGSIEGKKALVVDDICDGGGTFLALASALAEQEGHAEELNLYVTHGIFSKGKELLLSVYDKVEAYNDWTI